MAQKTQGIYDQLPPTNSVVGSAEEFVREAAKRMVAARDALTSEVVGATGRPFGHMPLSDEEAYAKYKMMRDTDDPNIWSAELQGGKVNEITSRWRKFEERYAQETRVLSDDDVAQLVAQGQQYGL